MGTGSTTASVLLEDGQELSFGAFSIKALATPGHTPGCISFQLEGMHFSSVPKLFLEQETQVLQPEADEEHESLFFFQV